MIINSVRINEEANKILIDVTATNLSKVLFWNSDTFKDVNQAINLSNLIPQGSNNYVFTINNYDVSVPYFSGLFFIEFTSDDEIKTSVVANLMVYQECLLNKVLSMRIEGCKDKSPSCRDCEDNTLNIQVLIDALYTSIQFGFFEEAIRILEVLDEDCEVCNTCPPYGDVKLLNGYGFGTIDNSIILL